MNGDIERCQECGRTFCGCPCGCQSHGRNDDDGTPGLCDLCRMNIHREAS